MCIGTEGLLRAAETVLRVNGGADVMLRMPGLAVNGDESEQLGLAAPIFQDVPVGPAAWRRIDQRPALVLNANTVIQLMGSLRYQSAEALFAAAVGMVVSDVLFAIEGVTPLLCAGVPVAYRVALVAGVGL